MRWQAKSRRRWEDGGGERVDVKGEKEGGGEEAEQGQDEEEDEVEGVEEKDGRGRGRCRRTGVVEVVAKNE